MASGNNAGDVEGKAEAGAGGGITKKTGKEEREGGEEEGEAGERMRRHVLMARVVEAALFLLEGATSEGGDTQVRAPSRRSPRP